MCDGIISASTTTIQPDEPQEQRERSQNMTNESSGEGMDVTVLNGGERHMKERTGSTGVGDSLSAFMDMPLDVLYETFSFLDPNDILSLGRTNRSFKHTLSSPMAYGVWKRSMDRDKAPPCPSDWTASRWAALLYENHCQRCLSERPQPRDYSIRRRLCTKCRKAALINKNAVMFNHRWMYPHPQILMELTPFSPRRTNSPSEPPRQFWILTDIAETAMQLNDAANDKDTLATTVERRKRMVEEVAELAYQCEEWETKMEKRRAEEKARLVALRFDYISKQLEAMGYTEQEIGTVSYFAEGWEPTELSEAEWSQIKDSVITGLLGSRADVWRSVIYEKYAHYRSGLPSFERYKLPIEYALQFLPELDGRLDALSDPDNTTMDDFSDLDHRFPEIIRLLQDTLMYELEATLARNRSTMAIDLDPRVSQSDALDSVMCVLRCSRCYTASMLFGWAEVKEHNCGVDDWNYYDRMEADDDISEASVDVFASIPPLPFRLCLGVVEHIKQVINLVGLDPSTAAIQQMDALDPILCCRYCYEDHMDERAYFTWRTYIFHCQDVNTWRRNQHHAELAPPEISDVIRAKRADKMDESRHWHCNVMWCGTPVGSMWETSMRRTDCIAHLLQEHNIQNPIMDVDMYYFDLYMSYNTDYYFHPYPARR